MKTRTIAAGEFKARCLALLDEVAASGETLIVTKRGKPVARVIPPESEADLRAYLKRSVRTVGDITAPMDDWADWDPERELRP